MKKNVKIISAVLSLLLLVGAVVGISAFADDTPTVEIVGKNISYDGAVKTLYAVKAENAGDAKIGVQFYAEDPTDKNIEAEYTKYAAEKITLGEAEYDVVFSHGFRPTELRKSIFAVPVLVDASGAVIAKGAAVEYSPYIYAMNRFNKDATNDQVTLYTALLDYGAAVQRALSTAEEIAANGGYADEYYAITAESALATNLAEKTALVSGTFSKADIAAGEIVASEKLDDIDFAAWADVDGNAIRFGSENLAVIDVKPGKNVFTAVYGNYSDVATKSSDFSASGFVSVVGPEIYTIPAGASHDGTATESDNALTLTNGELVYNKRTGNWQWMRFYGIVGTYADAFYMETKIKFDNVKVTHAGNFKLYPETWSDGYKGIAETYIIPNSKDIDENGYVNTFTFGAATLNAGTQYTLRVEYQRATKTIVGYVDGEAVYVAHVPNAVDNGCNAFRFTSDSGIANADVYFDDASFGSTCLHNSYTSDTTNKLAFAGNKTFYKVCDDCALPDEKATFTTDGYYGQGTYFNDDEMPGTKYDMSSTPVMSANSAAGKLEYVVADGVMSVTNISWGYSTIRVKSADGTGSYKVLPGQKFVTEFDFQYNGYDENDTEAPTYHFMGLATAQNGSNTSHIVTADVNYNNQNYASFGALDKAKGFLARDVWYNYRLEYTYNEDGTASYAAYLNGDLELYKGTIAADKAKDVIYGWGMCARGSAELTYKLDNVYMGVVCTEHDYQENTENLDAYIFNGTFYKSCSVCGKFSNETFTIDTEAVKGSGTYFGDETMTSGKADVENTMPKVTVGKLDNNGLVYGAADGTYNITCVRWSYLTLASNSPVTLAAGEKFVQEFDFMYDGATDHPADKSGRVYAGLANSATGSNSALVLAPTGRAGSCSIFTTAKYAYISLEGGTNNKTELIADVWYNVRAEYIISEDGTSATYNLYINGVLDSTATDDTPATTIAGWLMQPSKVENENLYFKFDNFFMGKVCTEHTYQDEEPSLSTLKGISDTTGNYVFYNKLCTNCGAGIEAYELTDVDLGEGKYYGNANMSGKRQDYTGVTLTGNSDGVFAGSSSNAKPNFALGNEDGNDIFNIIGSTWGYINCKVKNMGTTNSIVQGDKLVAEFDFRIMDGYGDADPTFVKFYLASEWNGTTTNAISPQMNLCHSNESSVAFTLGNATLFKGVWYNIRLEQIVGGTFTLYVNDKVAYTQENVATSVTNFAGFAILTRGARANASIDNLFVAINPTETPAE